MTLKTISQTFNIKGKAIEIRGIEAYVCEECGEIVYTSTESKMIEKVIGAVNEGAQEEVSALNLTEHSKRYPIFYIRI